VAVDLAAEGGGRAELGGAGPEDVLVVRGGDGGADEWAHPEDPLQSHIHIRQRKPSIDVKTPQLMDSSDFYQLAGCDPNDMQQ
jgi:hypothetical protein